MKDQEMDNGKYISCNSWMIVSRETHKAVYEFYNPRIIDIVNYDKYYVLTAEEYLGRFNSGHSSKG